MGNSDSDAGAKKLADAIITGGGKGDAWQPAELAAMLQHLLAAPFRADLESVSRSLVRRFDDFAGSDASSRTIDQLLTVGLPRIELLRIVKDFAKVAIAGEEGSIPEELGAVIYYASICCAWKRYSAKIHSLSDEALRLGLEWALEQSWLTESLRELFVDHLADLRTND